MYRNTILLLNKSVFIYQLKEFGILIKRPKKKYSTFFNQIKINYL